MALTDCPALWLWLPVPEGWAVDGDARRRRARSPDGALELSWHRLGPLPLHPTEWVRRVCGAGAAMRHSETVAGWPVVLAETGGGAGALRLGAFYAFLEHGGHALVHAGDDAAWTRERERVLDALLAAGPDLDELLVSVEQFFQP